MKTKRENEKDKERKDKSGNNTSPHTAKKIMLTRTKNANCTSKVLFFLIFFVT